MIWDSGVCSSVTKQHLDSPQHGLLATISSHDAEQEVFFCLRDDLG
jgi:hypothetical protein